MNTFNDFLMPDLLGPDSNFIPLFTAEDEDRIRKEKVSDTLPILPLRNTVLFPGMVIHRNIIALVVDKGKVKLTGIGQPVAHLLSSAEGFREPEFAPFAPCEIATDQQVAGITVIKLDASKITGCMVVCKKRNPSAIVKFVGHI